MKKIIYILGLITFSCFSQENSIKNFHKRQDSLRNELLKIKNDKLLRETIFEEVYIRGLVKNGKECLKFILPFNLHGLDCGAPDCYTTELKFEIPNNSPLTLPETIKISAAEYGCVENKKWDNLFKLVEISENTVNYYSAEIKSNLYFTKNGRMIYYPNDKARSVTLSELDGMYERWEFDSAEFAPYLSTIMTTMEYQLFLKKK